MYNSQLRAHCNAVVRSLFYFIAAGQESGSNSATAVILPVSHHIQTAVRQVCKLKWYSLSLLLLSTKHK